MLITMLVAAALVSSPSYPEDQSVKKGETPKPPVEFVTGTATHQQALAWTASILCDSNDQAEVRLDLAPHYPVLFAPDRCGSHNTTYFVFGVSHRGYKYLGMLEDVGAYRVAAPDRNGHPRIVTYYGFGADDAVLSLEVLGPDGFKEVKRKNLNESHAEGLPAGFLDSPKPATAQELQAMFGK